MFVGARARLLSYLLLLDLLYFGAELRSHPLGCALLSLLNFVLVLARANLIFLDASVHFFGVLLPDEFTMGILLVPEHIVVGRN